MARWTDKSEVDEAEDVVLEAVEEHHVAETLMAEIRGLTSEDEEFDAKVTVLIESVRHHKDEEENEMFPKVRKAFSEQDLEALGEQLAAAKEDKQRRSA